MIYLFTGLPGASKTLNTVTHLVETNRGDRPNYYSNIRNFVLDYDFLNTFAGWFYSYYMITLTDESKRKKILKIVSRCHEDDRNVDVSDMGFLKTEYESSNPMDTFDYWVRRLYSKKQLESYQEIYDLLHGSAEFKFSNFTQLNLHFTKFENPHEWFLLPKKSRILIDEIQEFFPPRSASKEKPKSIGELETHRHKGYDLFFITQDGMLVDVNIRRLVGQHTHFYNSTGGKRISKSSSPKYFDPSNPFDTKTLEKTVIKHNKRFYGSYYSAEMHTRKFKVPKFVKVFLLIVLLMAGFITYGFTSLGKYIGLEEPKPVSQVSESTSNPVAPSVKNDGVSKQIKDYLTNVVITGHVSRTRGKRVDHYYLFEDKKKGLPFYPENLGFKVIAQANCSAKVVLNRFSQVLTCEPYGSVDSEVQPEPRERIKIF